MILDGQRDFIGYANSPPKPHWPNNSRIAINLIMNYEEGGELNIQDGDDCAESFLAEIPGYPSREGQRSYFTESVFEYGARAGCWRLLNLFNELKIQTTLLAVGQAAERNPEFIQAVFSSGHEIAGHGYRWIDYAKFSENDELKHINKTLDIIEKITGERPVGWYTGRRSPNTVALSARAGLKYSCDDYRDDLPFWVQAEQQPLLIIPYSMANNDAKYAMLSGWTGEDFLQHLKASFDCLYREGEHCPKLMTVGVHARISGHPARAEIIRRFLEYVLAYEDVWICRRDEVASHWYQNFSYEQSSPV